MVRPRCSLACRIRTVSDDFSIKKHPHRGVQEKSRMFSETPQRNKTHPSVLSSLIFGVGAGWPFPFSVVASAEADTGFDS